MIFGIQKQYRFVYGYLYLVSLPKLTVARERRRGDRPPTKNKCKRDGGYIYLVNVGRQGIRCLLVVKNGVGVAT